MGLPLNSPAEQISQEVFPFQWVAQYITYREKDLDRWMQLPITSRARKLYKDECAAPIFILVPNPSHIYLKYVFFKKLESMVTRFIWRGKVPRIKLKSLFYTPQYGRLKLPSFELFSWAA